MIAADIVPRLDLLDEHDLSQEVPGLGPPMTARFVALHPLRATLAGLIFHTLGWLRRGAAELLGSSDLLPELLEVTRQYATHLIPADGITLVNLCAASGQQEALPVLEEIAASAASPAEPSSTAAEWVERIRKREPGLAPTG